MRFFFFLRKKALCCAFPLLYSIFFLLVVFYFWGRDIVREGTYQGRHTLKVQKSIKLGIILFIISELMFFVSFFWAFFHLSLNPTIELGNLWPPSRVVALNPFHVPLLNTLILVSSGVTVTRAHIYLLNGDKQKSLLWTLLTVVLGVYFSALQLYEYKSSTFTFADSAYGSVFFLATGFHGFHVLVGTILIGIRLTRLGKNHFSPQRHLNFELSCWYWHFVDLIWLFLFLSIYWWGN